MTNTYFVYALVVSAFVCASYTDAVAFTAVFAGGTMAITSNQIIKYETVYTNIGNGYNAATGIFTAPVSGIYSLSASMMTPPNESAHLMMLKNGVQLVTLFTGPNGYEMASHTINVALNANDRVWMQQWSGRVLHGFQIYNLFSGALI